MYIAEAEATLALQEQLLAYDPAKIYNLYYGNLSEYLGYIQRLVRFLMVHFSKILIII